MHGIMQGDLTRDRPFKRVKFSSPAPSPAKNQLSSNTKSRAPSVPITPLIRSRTPQLQHDDISSSPAPATRYRTSFAPRHDSRSDLPATARVQPSGPSDDSEYRSGQKKPLKALASFLGSFLVTARNATQMQAEASSRSSAKRKRKKSAHPLATETTSNVPNLPKGTREIVGKNVDSRPLSAPHLQPLGSLHSFIQTSVRNHSSTAEGIRQTPTRPLRTLTARSRLFLKSVQSQPAVIPVLSPTADILSRRRPNPHIASYIGQLPAGQAVESQPAPWNTTLSPIHRPLHRSLVPMSHTSVPTASPPQQILAALQQPKAQIVLSSTPTLSEDSFRDFVPIFINDNSEQFVGMETPDRRLDRTG